MMAPFAAYRSATEGRIPAGRFATPDEVAAMVVFVASPLSAATNGAALRVDGGVVKSAF